MALTIRRHPPKVAPDRLFWTQPQSDLQMDGRLFLSASPLAPK